MDKLLEALAERGIKVSGLKEEETLKLAKAVGLEPLDFLPREVELVDYTNKRNETNRFIRTPAFVVGHEEGGKAKTIQGLFLRVDALDQAIADLQAAKQMVDSEE